MFREGLPRFTVLVTQQQLLLFKSQCAVFAQQLLLAAAACGSFVRFYTIACGTFG